MARNKLKRLLVSLSLAMAFLLLILGTLSLSASASPTRLMPQSGPETIAGLAGGWPAGIAEASVRATEVPSISNIIGATYDRERGEVVVFGIADPDLPPLSFSYVRENLVIALRAFYNSDGPDIPGVSIEGTRDPLQVIYFGTVTDTHFGQVSFESDRLLKTYTMGVDNITGITMTADVPGYMSYPDRMGLLTETETDPVLIRYFFTPTLLVEPIAPSHTIIFSRTQQFVDWAYMSGATSAATTEAAQGFVDNFNQHYWEYAADRQSVYGDTTLYEMIQLSKLTGIADWMSDQDLHLELPGINDPWLRHYPVAYQATARQTPGIVVSWVQDIGGTPHVMSLRGGVYAIGDILYIPPTEEGQSLASDVRQGIDQLQPPPMVAMIRPKLDRPMGEPGQSEGPCVAYVISIADNAVANGDFEDGPASAPWGQDSTSEMIRPESPHNGSYGALFPVYHNASVALSQTLYIPGDATMARLTYWRAAATAETTHAHDYFSSFLADANGARLVTLETLDDGDADRYWHQVSFDVGAYAGRTVQLWFVATTDAANITNFFVDDVSLDYLDLMPPTVEAVTAPERVTRLGTTEFELVFREPMKTGVVPAATLHLQGGQAVYTLTAKTGVGYTNGYLDSDPTRWYGQYAFSSQAEEGTLVLNVSAGQDMAGNVMHSASGVHTLVFDASSPQVQSASPVDGVTGVALDASIVITFSEAIDVSSFAYVVSPDPGGWVVVWDGEQQVATLTHNDFASGTTYSVSVTEAKDRAGNSLKDAPATWSFSTLHTVYLPTVLR